MEAHNLGSVQGLGPSPMASHKFSVFLVRLGLRLQLIAHNGSFQHLGSTAEVKDLIKCMNSMKFTFPDPSSSTPSNKSTSWLALR
mmetsp:Transcript_139912/g.447495  ORF Transcript_139912/g.447495 Transcript_139912/m.447495 type:complete len:85 (+) Transcript_139912:118-372(+)